MNSDLFREFNTDNSVIIKENNTIYTGSVHIPNNSNVTFKHGYGILQTNDVLQTNIYEGIWHYNVYHGKGHMFDENGKIIYKGMFRYGVRHGQGDEYSDDKIVYSGEWCNDVKHGIGTWIGETSIYHGSWSNGLRHGFGKEMYNGMTTFEGTWINNHKEKEKDGYEMI